MSDFQFFETTHSFYLKGKELLAVSKVFETLGITDFSRVPAKYMDPARAKGDFVHGMAQFHGLKRLAEDQIPFEYQGYLEAIKKYYRERVKRVVAIEQPVYSAALGCAGIPDLIAFDFDDALCIDDFKTPLKINRAVKWQLAAYKIMFEKLKKMTVKKRHAVQLFEDGNYELIPFENHRRDEDGFRSLLTAAQLLRGDL